MCELCVCVCVMSLNYYIVCFAGLNIQENFSDHEFMSSWVHQFISTEMKECEFTLSVFVLSTTTRVWFEVCFIWGSNWCFKTEPFKLQSNPWIQSKHCVVTMNFIFGKFDFFFSRQTSASCGPRNPAHHENRGLHRLCSESSNSTSQPGMWRHTHKHTHVMETTRSLTIM